MTKNCENNREQLQAQQPVLNGNNKIITIVSYLHKQLLT